ncbi:hypothetical protein BOX15_Mlig020612g1 [Macrostomum lignano]|uniref:Coiled-coil domain-containing protein 40 n=1 Tax=Macrostomum lignano TaxID=282301 RepID=A0A267F5J2_9PLAT|nr:hypothetical protein BOX15_Mlig020612g1 [Macrostomum lignano]
MADSDPNDPFEPRDDEDIDDLDDANAVDLDDEDNEDVVADVNEEAQSEDENELIVLDPDHPLMERFQQRLKNLLERQVERLQVTKREQDETLKKKRQQHLELGNELYNLQQELAKAQMHIEKAHDDYTEAKRGRQQKEMALDDTRRMFKEMSNAYNQEKRKEADLRQEVDNLALRLFYMRNAREDVLGDIAVMKRAAEKADGDLSKAEDAKMRQDHLVDRLVEQTDRLREDIALYDAQMAAQGDEIKAAKDGLADAQSEIQTIAVERKQLMSQWNSSLIGLTRRNEAHSTMLEALNQRNEQIRSLGTEAEAYAKSISKEQEQNEKLTLILNKTEKDFDMVKRQLMLSRNKHDQLKQEFSVKTRQLHETESHLERANAQIRERKTELDALRKQIERENLEKVRLTEEITEQIRSRLTMKKAAEYTQKLTGKVRDRTREVETQIALVENEISKDQLEAAHVRARLRHNQTVVESLDKEIAAKNTVITKSEQDQSRNNIDIERKQGEIDLHNKRLEQLIASAGGVELGPLEITINSLGKSIAAKQEEIAGLEQMWLREQHELVKIVNERSDLTATVNRLKKQLMILGQKKLRIEGNIEREQKEKQTVERSLNHLQTDMQRLNGLIYRETDAAEQLRKHNALLETDFVRALKEEEKVSLQLREKLEQLKEEKNRLLTALIDAEQRIMLWEKKIQLAQETRAAVDSDIGQAEIKAMRSEIHRMEVRLGQLMRQQEQLIQEMEKSVSRRDTIATRGEAQARAKVKVVTKGAMQRELNELRKRIKQTIKTTNECDEDIEDLRQKQSLLESEIAERNERCNQLQQEADRLNETLASLTDMKQMQIFDLQSRQQTARYYQQVREGKYKPLYKDSARLEEERQRQQERTQALSLVIERVSSEHPQVLRAIGPCRSMINTRLGFA